MVVDGITACNITDAEDPPWKREMVYSYDKFVVGYLRETKFWADYAKRKNRGFIPPLCPGFSNRGYYEIGIIDEWLFEFTEVAPYKFRQMCENSRHYVDPKLNIVAIEAFNENSERATLESTIEYGFGYLHQPRDVFSIKPVNGWPEEAVPNRLY